jgi:hypothetical protein
MTRHQALVWGCPRRRDVTDVEIDGMNHDDPPEFWDRWISEWLDFVRG